jgi:hypothetical protein
MHMTLRASNMAGAPSRRLSGPRCAIPNVTHVAAILIALRPAGVQAGASAREGLGDVLSGFFAPRARPRRAAAAGSRRPGAAANRSTSPT